MGPESGIPPFLSIYLSLYVLKFSRFLTIVFSPTPTFSLPVFHSTRISLFHSFPLSQSHFNFLSSPLHHRQILQILIPPYHHFYFLSPTSLFIVLLIAHPFKFPNSEISFFLQCFPCPRQSSSPFSQKFPSFNLLSLSLSLSLPVNENVVFFRYKNSTSIFITELAPSFSAFAIS